jgi:hypothetical protein
MYWKFLNMEMNLWELAIHLNIINIAKDYQRICSDFIFTVVCCAWWNQILISPKQISYPDLDYILQINSEHSFFFCLPEIDNSKI